MLAFQFDQHLFAPLAALASAVGTVLLRVLDSVFQRRAPAQPPLDAETRLLAETTEERRELLDERVELRNRLAQSEALAAEWREKYFALRQEVVELRSRPVEGSKGTT